MMKKYVIYLFALSVISCTKEEFKPENKISNDANEADYSSAIQLKVGNYWIYGHTPGFNELEPFHGVLDSVWIERDSIVSNRVYFLEKSSGDKMRWLYDSAHCIVATNSQHHDPTIIFSGTNYSDTLVSNPYSYAKMVESNHNLNTRWGVMQSSRYFADAKGNQPFNTDSLHYPIKETFYVKGIGMVAENYQSCGMAHKKLIRYKVDNRFNP